MAMLLGLGVWSALPRQVMPGCSLLLPPPAPQTCLWHSSMPPTADQAHNLDMCHDRELNWRSSGTWDDTQPLSHTSCGGGILNQCGKQLINTWGWGAWVGLWEVKAGGSLNHRVPHRCPGVSFTRTECLALTLSSSGGSFHIGIRTLLTPKLGT